MKHVVLFLLLAAIGAIPLVANADLTITTVQTDVNFIDPPPDGSTPVTFIISNIGNQTAFNFWIGGYANRSGNCTSGLVFESQAFVSRLDPGASLQGTYMLHARAGDTTLRAVVKADITSVVVENNENNNCRVSLGTLTVRYPDLRVQNTIGPNPNQFVAGGDSALFSATIINQEYLGNNSGYWADASYVRFYISSAISNPPVADRLESKSHTPPLGVLETATVDSEIAVPEGFPLGSYRLFAEADGNEDVIEGRENNNFSSGVPIEVVDICQLADVDNDGFVTISDLVAVVNGSVALVNASNSHLNLRRSPAPLPELVDRLDLLTALVCFGSFQFEEDASGTLQDFQVQALGAGEYGVVLDVEGQVHSVQTYVKMPYGFDLAAAQAKDIMNTGYTAHLSPASDERVLVNEFHSFGAETASLNGWLEACRLTPSSPIDLSQTQTVSQLQGSGITVVVLFGDGTRSVLHKRFTYVDIPDPAFRSYLETTHDLQPGAPIPESLVNGTTSVSVPDKGITSLEGIQAFSSLTFLRCDNNQLQNLPDLSGLTNLTTLVASSNNLKYLPQLPSGLINLSAAYNHLIAIPQLGDLSQLYYVNLAHNELSGLPDLSALNNLEYLVLNFNRLSSLPEIQGAVRVIIAHDNRLTDLPNFTNQTFEVLDLHNNYLFNVHPLTQTNYTAGSEVFLSNNNLDSMDCPDILGLQSLVGILYKHPQRMGDTSCTNVDR